MREEEFSFSTVLHIFWQISSLESFNHVHLLLCALSSKFWEKKNSLAHSNSTVRYLSNRFSFYTDIVLEPHRNPLDIIDKTKSVSIITKINVGLLVSISSSFLSGTNSGTLVCQVFVWKWDDFLHVFQDVYNREIYEGRTKGRFSRFVLVTVWRLLEMVRVLGGTCGWRVSTTAQAMAATTRAIDLRSQCLPPKFPSKKVAVTPTVTFSFFCPRVTFSKPKSLQTPQNPCYPAPSNLVNDTL
jgi:hypothetical protein